ncbi:MAG: hypothetical protein HKN04_13250 [Rhodothermaceae bacterium]|nr:hypothetical protein [Rhodothermaceae bacterium]
MRTQQNIAAMRHQSNMNALRGAAQRSQIIANTYSEISDLSHQGFMNRMQSSDEMQRRGVNAIHGQYDVYNPSTGDITHGVPNHANHYWVDAFGNTIGTEIDENPDPFRFTRGQNLDNLYDTGGF